MHLPAWTRPIAFYAAAAVLAALVQVSLPDRSFGILAKPDLLLVLPILAGYLSGPLEGASVGLACGFLRDAFAGRAMGAGMLVGLYAGLAAGLLFRRLFRKSLLPALLQVAVVAPAAHLLVELAGLVFQGAGSYTAASWAASFLGRALPLQTALDLAAAVPIFLLLRFAGPHPRPKKGLAADDAAKAMWTS